jgi:hypothetical protein
VSESAGTVESDGAEKAEEGDIVTFAYNKTGRAINVNGANTTFENVTVHASLGFGFYNSSGEGDTHLTEFRLVPGPPPPNSTVDPDLCMDSIIQADRADDCPIMTSSWDGLQFKGVKVGPTIVDSTVVNAGDDSMSIQGLGPVKVWRVDGNRAWISYNEANGYVGRDDRLQQWVGDDWAVVTSTASCTPTASAPCEYTQGAEKVKVTSVVTLNRTPPWNAGSNVADIDRMGNNFEFRHNTIDSSARGLLLKAHGFPTDYGLIENNTIRGSQAISFTPQDGDYSDSHASTGGYLTIAGNTFRSALWSASGGWSDNCEKGAVSFWGRTTTRRAFSNIDIVDNIFENIRGLNLNINGATDVEVRGNKFIEPHQSAIGPNGNPCDIPHSSVVHVQKSDDVTFASNTIEPTIGPYSKEQVSVGEDAAPILSGVTVQRKHLTVDFTKTYTLTNRKSELLLAAPEGGGLAQQRDWDTARQSWRIHRVAPGIMRIQNVGSGLYLTGTTGSAVEMQPLSTTNDRQRWTLLDTDHNTAKIVNVASGKMLGFPETTDEDDFMSPGEAVPQSDVSGQLAQNWRFEAEIS